MPFARELTTAMMPTGSVMGALLSWTLVDMAQPRLVTAYATLLWILGSLVQMIAPSIGVVRSGRLICGLAAGIISAVVPPYLAEIAGRSSRGKFASVGQMAGVSESDRMRYSASQSDSEMRVIVVNLLRCSFAVQMVPGFMLLLLCDLVPPSPRQLAAEGRWPEAKSLLADLHASGDGEDARVLAHIQELQGDILSQPQVPHPSGELLTRRVRARLVLGMLVAAWSQLCGVHLVLHTIMLPTAGAGFDSVDLVVGLQYVLYISITLLAMSLLDFWGRRLMLKLGCLAMIISLCGMGFFQSKRIEEAAKDDNGLNMTYVPWVIKSYHGPSLGVILFCYLFIITYAVSWGPIAWVYPAEIFPGWLRTRGFSFCMAAYWTCNAVMAWGLPSLGNTTNHCLVNWIVLLYVFYAVHETKGYTLEEMNHVFLSGRRAWQPVSGQRIFDLLVARIERRRNLNGTDGAAGGPGDEIELSEWASRQAGHPDSSPS
ncbi:uncharacterized protein TRIREDRAFT_61278 [Trichoderma reesei QM6a]|uniref:Predicted protein n=2 Tax=Hypocrea jecorina TaxID=51453 RepID=G0RIG4_HYPJQ|nr:uncharacterized protein TRIREDRAFT_61278 [Trichoderma reesei QM6a]EGR49115.1 predicted protein [Trichoderma reesei QM6a]